MTDHLPECAERRAEWRWSEDCICDRLRACEQRVRLEDDDYAYVAAQAEADGRRRGWTEALDAAREAVNRLASDMANWSSAETAAATEATPDLTADQWMWAQRGVHRALAAIDALRDKQ